ncbi:hypothetical protein ACFL27_21610 [candidate division CSSED10-310 bacterium]|uniref:NarG-like domain-containing protein n=1 Tax=candidate division CSSED10-310 bacterium TaxID=2855610 RepID=A0ABV6Z2X0_UNCC1
MDYIVWEKLGVGTRLLMNQLHYGGLVFMIIAYTYKIYQLLQKPKAVEGTPARGNHKQAIAYSYMTLAMPWEIESQRKHWYRYLEFAFFHLAMAVGIGFAFLVPIIHETMKNPVIAVFCWIFFGFGFLIGLSRLGRRIFKPEMRLISTPDDYFCLVLLTLWMFSGLFTAFLTSSFWLFWYYFLATFFLFYVPFSKISHYVYYPFIRFHVGKHFGHRGVYPKKRVAVQT